MVDFGKALRDYRASKLQQENQKQMAEPTSGQLALLNKMSGMVGSFNRAKSLKNPFGQTKLPVGDYIFQLTRAALTESGQAGKPKDLGVLFIFVCQCTHPDGNWDDVFGEQVRVSRKFKGNPESGTTVDDAIERLIYDLQDLGVETDKMQLMGPVDANNGEFTLLQLLSWFTENGIYVKGSITQSEPNKKGVVYKNLQSISRLSNEQCFEIMGEGNFTPVNDGTQLAQQQLIDTTSPEDAQLADADYAPDEGTEGQPVEDPNAAPANWFEHAGANYRAGFDDNGNESYWDEAGNLVQFDADGNVTIVAPFDAGQPDQQEYVPYVEEPVAAPAAPKTPAPVKTVGPPKQAQRPTSTAPVQQTAPAAPARQSVPVQKPPVQQSAPVQPAGLPSGPPARVAAPRPQPGAGVPGAGAPKRSGPPKRP